jgi:hypothetical protein
MSPGWCAGSLMLGRKMPICGAAVMVTFRVLSSLYNRDHDRASSTPNEPAVGTTQACEIRDLLDRLADKWSLLVVELLGRGTRRFTELRRGLEPTETRSRRPGRCTTASRFGLAARRRPALRRDARRDLCRCHALKA